MHHDSRRDWADHRVARIMNEEFPGSRLNHLLGWLREAGVALGEWFPTGSGVDAFDNLDDESLSSCFADDDDLPADNNLFTADSMEDSDLTFLPLEDDGDRLSLFQDDPLDGGINPVTGLPMFGITDIGGSPYGSDLHSHDHDWHDSSFDTGPDHHDGSFGHHDWD